MRSTRRGLSLLTSAVLAAGCHTFRPATVEDVAPGQTIRARITGAYSDSLSTLLMRDARDLEGLVVANDEASLLLEVPVQQTFEGMRFRRLSQRVDVPARAVVDIEVKELSRGRTLGAVALVGGAVGALVWAQLNKDTGGGNQPGGNGPVEAVVPLSITKLGALLRR